MIELKGGLEMHLTLYDKGPLTLKRVEKDLAENLGSFVPLLSPFPPTRQIPFECLFGHQNGALSHTLPDALCD